MNKSITVTYVYDNLVILTNTEIDESIQLDESGSMVWKLIEKGMTKEEIIKNFNYYILCKLKKYMKILQNCIHY